MKKSEIIFGLLRIPVDFTMIALAFVTAYILRKQYDLIPYYNKTADLTSFPDISTYTKLVTIFGVVLIILLISHKAYSLKIYSSFNNEIKNIFSSWLKWIGLILIYYFIKRYFPFSRLVIIFGWCFSLIYLITGRWIIKYIQKIFLQYGIGRRKIIIIGYNKLLYKILPQLKKNKQYQIVGIVGNKKPAINQFKKLKTKYLGNINQIKEILKKHKIEEVIQIEKDTEIKAINIMELCRLTHIYYHFIPDKMQLHNTNIDIQLVNNYPIITLNNTSLKGWGKVNKRLFDIIFSLIVLILLSPFFILIAILIKLDSKGPVFFTKLDNDEDVKRVGEKGRLFKFYKFRSMYNKTHNLRYTKLAKNNKRSGPMVKIINDPRITKIGKFIRKYDIDELPQFWNVLKGDMSVVGPRPHLPEEVAKYEDHQRFVLSIKPGITGLSQVNGRSNLDFNDEINLDTFYIENWSTWLDIKIILKTILIVIVGKGE